MKQTSEMHGAELHVHRKRLDDAEKRNVNLLTELNGLHRANGREDIVEMNEFLLRLRMSIEGRSVEGVEEIYNQIIEEDVMGEE